MNAHASMLKSVAIALVALALAVPDALAQSTARGQSLYGQLGCNSGNCHGPDPATNTLKILNGANSPGAIEFAALTRTEMNQLSGYFLDDSTIAADIAAWLATVAPAPPAPPPVAAAVEYFHAGFGHYFTTNLAAEIAALDAGQFAGWVRTGHAFNAYASSNGAVIPVCRFFTTAFPPKSSHFYTPVASECQGLRAGGPWQYEGEAFFVQAPDATGGCAAGSKPVYRLYNGGQGGAPNHRYTTDAAVRTQMIAQAWVPEGLGTLGVIFCAPD